jgi:hypothetical protein
MGPSVSRRQSAPPIRRDRASCLRSIGGSGSISAKIYSSVLYASSTPALSSCSVPPFPGAVAAAGGQIGPQGKQAEGGGRRRNIHSGGTLRENTAGLRQSCEHPWLPAFLKALASRSHGRHRPRLWQRPRPLPQHLSRDRGMKPASVNRNLDAAPCCILAWSRRTTFSGYWRSKWPFYGTCPRAEHFVRCSWRLCGRLFRFPLLNLSCGSKSGEII